ncbi:response regulator transcription factor [Paenibacillus aurantius]|uniref:Response regulator transcription factor n=1 Tax=Paenibacillus aurantius TaxID=2918900 RepID=A0AA96REV9_9BACL|nr:response regulator transcription factor [Paenibacillus aurantius]WNQ11307.1 response regulator transcription factor [Paenibacillus aurantius]
MKRILYIEDDSDIGTWVKEDLEKRGYAVDWLLSGEGAAERVKDSDAVVLDVMLPGLDGFSVGRRLKREMPGVPVLMLSARSAVEDKVEGLQFADDYLTKPFHPDELAARLEVLLRRFDKGEDGELRLGHLLVHLGRPSVIDTRTQEEIGLTAKQLQILQCFLRHPNQILTKEQLYESVWGEPYMEGDKTVNVHIRYLREKLEIDPGAPAIIETVRGLGYRVRV